VAMQILRHGQIAMSMEVCSEVPAAETRSALKRLGRQLHGELALLYGHWKGPVLCSKSALEVELRGFEPLTPSMRTLGDEVVRGRWGGHEIGGSLREPLAAYDVAVYECCTPDWIGSPRPEARGLRACPSPVHLGLHAIVAQVRAMGRTGMNVGARG
jgi:hypothetical protein